MATVLVVDDNAANRELIVMLLTWRGGGWLWPTRPDRSCDVHFRHRASSVKRRQVSEPASLLSPAPHLHTCCRVPNRAARTWRPADDLRSPGGRALLHEGTAGRIHLTRSRSGRASQGTRVVR